MKMFENPSPRPINELGIIYRQTERLKLKGCDQKEVREITGYHPAETFEQFLNVNSQLVFEEVIR